MKKVMIVFALVLGLGFYGFIPQGNAQMGPGMMGPGYTGPERSGQWNYCPYCGRPLPNGGYGMGPGYGNGYGYGMGPGMMGQGGYGMGPGMMGQGGYGMMGQGGYGMGPGMMGQGGYGMMGPGGGQSYGPQYQGNRKALTEKDAKEIVENYLKASRNPNLKLGEIEDKDNAFEASIVTKKEGALVDRIAIDKRTGWMHSVH
jgi:hypothetical protein